MENYFFLEHYVTSEGAVSHIVLYYQPLPITRSQERFGDDNYFEQLPILCTLPLILLQPMLISHMGDRISGLTEFPVKPAGFVCSVH